MTTNLTSSEEVEEDEEDNMNEKSMSSPPTTNETDNLLFNDNHNTNLLKKNSKTNNQNKNKKIMINNIEMTLSCDQTRLIARNDGNHPNVKTRGTLNSHLYLYHQLIDATWFKLFFIIFVVFALFNVLFATVFYSIDGVRNNVHPDNSVSWYQCFNFALQSMDTIGYGGLLPKGEVANWMVFLQSYLANIFWTLFTALVFAKLSRPSRLKRQIRFSDVAVINCNTRCFVPIFPKTTYNEYSNNENEQKNDIILRNFSQLVPPKNNEIYQINDNNNARLLSRDEQLLESKWNEYGEYKTGDPCLVFRFAHQRYRSRLCDGNFNLLFFKRITREDGYEDYVMEELAYEINEQFGRVRAMKQSIPLLSLPWTVVHRIDKLSPLYGLTKEDMINYKVEIIGIVDGVDEATSDNFQAWFSYVPDEIYFNYEFEPMVKGLVVPHKKNVKQVLEIDFSRISKIRHV